MNRLCEDKPGWLSSELYLWRVPRRVQWIRRKSDTIEFLDSTTVTIRTELTVEPEGFAAKLEPDEQTLGSVDIHVDQLALSFSTATLHICRGLLRILSLMSACKS
jgi:hypothetical protein